MKESFTPGPWRVVTHKTSYGINGGPEGHSIANITLGYRREHLAEEKYANALAIAAVPAMIEALVTVRNYLMLGPRSGTMLDELDAVLRLAGVKL